MGIAQDVDSAIADSAAAAQENADVAQSAINTILRLLEPIEAAADQGDVDAIKAATTKMRDSAGKLAAAIAQVPGEPPVQEPTPEPTPEA